MTALLRQAFEKLAAELPEHEQDAIANRLLDVIEDDERRWDKAFAETPEKAQRLADEALRAFHAGLTEPLDHDKL